MCMSKQLMCLIKSEVNCWLNASKLIYCHAMLPDDVSNVIVPLHVLTGSDHTSGFYSYGKKPLLQKLMIDPEARELLGRVGESLELKDEVKADTKAFILSKVFGDDIALTCGQARASKWQKLKKKSYSPPWTWWWRTEPPLRTNKFHHILPSPFHFGGTSNPNWPWLGNHQMANVNQCAIRCHHCPTRSWLLNICSIATMRAEVMMTVGQESQQIQISNMHNLKSKNQNDA